MRTFIFLFHEVVFFLRLEITNQEKNYTSLLAWKYNNIPRNDTIGRTVRCFDDILAKWNGTVCSNEFINWWNICCPKNSINICCLVFRGKRCTFLLHGRLICSSCIIPLSHACIVRDTKRFSDFQARRRSRFKRSAELKVAERTSVNSVKEIIINRWNKLPDLPC